MPPSSMKVLCRYHYDPLDRLSGLTPLQSPGVKRFYQNDELVNEIDSEAQLTIVRHGEQPLAQRLSVMGVSETALLATDQQCSPLVALTDTDSQRMAYTAYGHRSGESGLSCLLGFNGERSDSVTGHYLLGQGNRAFNPVLMRFNSPDELSPFGEGGINAYAYCGGDPINRYDPSGNGALFFLKNRTTFTPPPTPTPVPVPVPVPVPKRLHRPWEDTPNSTHSRPNTVSLLLQHSSHQSSVTAMPATVPNNLPPTVSAGEAYRKIKLPREGAARNTLPRKSTRTPTQQANYENKRTLAEQARYYDDYMPPHSPTMGLEVDRERYILHSQELQQLELIQASKEEIHRADHNRRHALKRLKQGILEQHIKRIRR